MYLFHCNDSVHGGRSVVNDLIGIVVVVRDHFTGYPAVIADFLKCFYYCGIINITCEKVNKTVETACCSAVIFEVNRFNSAAEDLYPMFGIAVKENVTDIKVRTNIGVAYLVDKVTKFDGRNQELIPYVFIYLQNLFV